MPDLEAQPSPSPASRPVPLSLVIDDSAQRPPLTYSGRPSGRSSPQSDSPVYESALDSTAPLILVHDNDEEDGYDNDRDVERPLAMDFSSSDEENDDFDDSLSPLYQINGKLSIPPLPPFTIFIYLLSPYLKFGALLLPYYQLPLEYGLSGLLISAILAVVARHLLYLLARYLRNADLEDVVGNTFVSTKKRGRKGERRRDFFKFLVRFGTAVLRILLAVVYLHECAHFIFPLVSPMNALHKSSKELSLAVCAVVIGLLLSYPGSLSSRLVVYTTYLSVFTYLLWLAAISYLYTQGTLPINSERLKSGSIWEGLITTAFIFTSSNTLPLYASTKGTIQQFLFDDAESPFTLPTGTTPSTGDSTRRNGNNKQPLYRSFKFLSLLSIVLGLCFILPLVGFAAYPNENPRAPASPPVSTGYPEQYPDWRFPRPEEDSTPATRIQTYITPALASLTLLFGVPQLLITIPTFPAGSLKWLHNGHRHASTPEPLSKLSLVLKKSFVPLLLLILTCVTTSFKLSTTIWPFTAAFAILATYYVPAILHILAHTFKSPLSIILPSTYFSSSVSTTTTNTPRASFMTLPAPDPSSRPGIGGSSLSLNGNDQPRSSTSARHQASSSRQRLTGSQGEHDDLLQRKERALQKRQMRRRIIWDIWAWAIFFGGFVVLGVRARIS
ncbi:hypothetical protein NP233_g2744 [Leucocoprinus birnbaumii]|uniref:Uncharacterized protein n=1 Tax=Leucocoprinus birnbaumii TaxID=56174 RepID=A0AAD5YYI4_9AGAR|nr:hypothetical protein NP233_g2744 [Leucocoprinus birnbaumii]